MGTTTIKTTDECKTWLDNLKSRGVFSFYEDGGINVPEEVRAIIELLHEFGASATIDVDRHQSGRLDTLTVTQPGDEQIFNGLEGDFNAAEGSLNGVKPDDNTAP
jgi:hypothetical protein